MIENRFSGLNFRQNILKSGAKVSGGADPIIKINSTYNSFTLTPKAMSLLGVAEGDYVQLYDMAGVEGVETMNDRFYISVGFKYNNVQQGAKIGKNGGFAFNIAWGAMILGDMEVKEITGDQLVDREIAILREMELKNGAKQKGYIALKKGTGMLVPYNEGEPVEVYEGVEVPMFAIQSLVFVEHDPKIAEEEE